jgi:hypothetical protein
MYNPYERDPEKERDKKTKEAHEEELQAQGQTLMDMMMSMMRGRNPMLMAKQHAFQEDSTDLAEPNSPPPSAASSSGPHTFFSDDESHAPDDFDQDLDRDIADSVQHDVSLGNSPLFEPVAPSQEARDRVTHSNYAKSTSSLDSLISLLLLPPPQARRQRFRDRWNSPAVPRTQEEENIFRRTWCRFTGSVDIFRPHSPSKLAAVKKSAAALPQAMDEHEKAIRNAAKRAQAKKIRKSALHVRRFGQSSSAPS